MMDLRDQNSGFLARSGSFCLDLGHFAWIWASLHIFGLLGRIWVRMGPTGDEALKMEWVGGDRHTYTYMDRSPLCATGLCPPLGRCPKTVILVIFIYYYHFRRVPQGLLSLISQLSYSTIKYLSN